MCTIYRYIHSLSYFSSCRDLSPKKNSASPSPFLSLSILLCRDGEVGMKVSTGKHFVGPRNQWQSTITTNKWDISGIPSGNQTWLAGKCTYFVR